MIQAVERRAPEWQSVVVSSSQHTDLLSPFLTELGIRVDHDLNVMTDRQTPANVVSRVMQGLTPILEETQPDVVFVQGDTSTAVAGGLAASMMGYSVGHVEAGLRTGNKKSPFPEEINRRLISQVADWHFCATRRNMRSLIDEKIPTETVFHTGNPVIDSLHHILATGTPSETLASLLARLANQRILVLTTHRRENFGERMYGFLRVVREFCDDHPEVSVVFPVHPNPNVREAAASELSGHPQIHLINPLEYTDFMHLNSKAWLIASDSGGLIEEIPTLGKAALILRDNTERTEAIDCGSAKIVGHDPERFREMLDDAIRSSAWQESAANVINPFGTGDAGERIVRIVSEQLSGATLEEQNLEFEWNIDEPDRRTASL